MSSDAGALVAVVGSANLDVVVAVDRFPSPGETVLGGDVEEIAGGKGLNQAVAAARTGTAALVACVGEDDAGQLLLSHLDERGVVARHVRRVGTPTGRAYIQVAPDGENSIVVAAGANALLQPDDVQRALDDLDATVVLCQLEVPMESVVAAATWARDRGVRFVLNPSPVRELPDSLMEPCDPLVLNVTEARQILQAPAGTDIPELAAGLSGRAVSVVVTDGPRGAYVGSAGGVQHVPGTPVEAVDTTGAGDEFAGRLAAALARGEDLATAAEGANLAAAHAVEVPRPQR